MYKIVNIGTQAIPMLANGATPYRFKQVFHMDLLKFFSEVDNGKNGNGEVAGVVEQLGFIMAAQAEKRDMNRIDISEFYEWLEAFEPTDLIRAGEEIMSVYASNIKQTSTAKKKTR